MLDLRLKRESNRITTHIYLKPTHTDQYLLWNLHYQVQQKLRIVTALDREGEIESSTDDLRASQVDLERGRIEREETVEE